MKEFGYVRVGASSPELKVADVNFNTEEIIKEIKRASESKVDILLFL